jgi:hypothetical protein
MRRKFALLPVLFVLPLAACGVRPTQAAPSPTVAPSPAVAPSPTVAAAPPVSPEKVATASPASTKKPVDKARASGSGDPRWGTQYAELASSKAATRQITYNLVLWYDGAQAVKACAEDGVQPAENDYCTGYYIRDHNPQLRTLTVDPDAPVRMNVNGEMQRVTLNRFLGQVTRGMVIRFTVDANRIVQLDQIYLP